MCSGTWIRGAIAPALLCAAGVAAATADSGQIVLDETCYWRRYYRFGASRYCPQALRAEGEQVLGKGGLARLRRETLRALAARRLDPAKVDWRDHVFQTLPGARAFDPSPTPPPAPGWAAADFDDASWVRLRGVFQGGPAAQITNPVLGQYDESVDLRLRAAYYRSRFVVDAPGQAGPLTLRLIYAGGARIFVNGREVARGHLPDGELQPDSPAEPYPAGAYADKTGRSSHRTIGPLRVPPEHVHKGTNVVAVEVRAGDFHPIVLTNPRQPNWGGPQRPWPHARLVRFELRSASPGIVSGARRPAGVQVWAEDMHHRVESTEYLPPGETPGTVRFVGARNGTYCAQVVIGADRALAGLRVRCGELVRADGAARLPADAVQALHMLAYPLHEWTLRRLGDERGLGASMPTNQQLQAYARMTFAQQPAIFDQITDTAQDTVPAGTCRPVWLRLRVPPDAAPGTYRGAIEVAAEGVPAVSLPVEAEVTGWRLPDPKDFRTFVGCEQSPYGVAKQYGVAPWSPRHVALLEGSFRQLGRIGNRWLNVPVLARTEFGNGTDSPIRWVRGRGGDLAFDFAALDKYLDLAVKHWQAPRVIQFVVMHGMRSPAVPPTPPQVPVVDEGGRRALLAVGAAQGQPRGGPLSPAQRRTWQAFAASLRAHMRSRKLDGAMFWGYPLEHEADPDLIRHLASCAPTVYWSAGPHEMMYNGTHAKNERAYRIVTDIRYQGGWPSFRDDRGWKSKTLHLLNPRVGGTVIALHTTSLPFAYRAMVDRALALGRSGFTRVGADEWAGVHYQGMDLPRWLTGIPVLFLLWPGPDGAEPGARFEALLEGVQETEARIFLEAELDARRLPPPIARKAEALLAQRHRETDFWQGNSIIHSMEQYHYGWQERSRRLYQLAGEVAGRLVASGGRRRP